MRAILSCLLITCFYFIACEKAPCKNGECGENAYCDAVEGRCLCMGGYLKDSNGDCTLRNGFRDIYVGTYIVTEQGMGASAPFTARITSNAGTENVSIVGHAGYVCTMSSELPAIAIPGTVSPSGMIFGDYYRTCSGTNYMFRGFAVTGITDSVFTTSYNVETNLGLVKSVTATFVMQPL